MADPKECAAVGALRRPRRTREDDRLLHTRLRLNNLSDTLKVSDRFPRFNVNE